MRARLEAGLTNGPGDALRVGRETALRGADAVDSLRASLANWFNFFNGYDPLFTWWMGLPFKHVDAGLQGYAVFLRDRVAPADLDGDGRARPPRRRFRRRRAPKFNRCRTSRRSWPLPPDEMIGVVQRFTGADRIRPRRRSLSSREPKYYQDWLAALKTLDFDKLSRNAQVDYLFIRTTSENQIARAKEPPQTNIPRKTDNSGITGDARGRIGLLHDLADEVIPYTPEAAHRARLQGAGVARSGDEEGVARRWGSATTGRRPSKR